MKKISKCSLLLLITLSIKPSSETPSIREEYSSQYETTFSLQPVPISLMPSQSRDIAADFLLPAIAGQPDKMEYYLVYQDGTPVPPSQASITTEFLYKDQPLRSEPPRTKVMYILSINPNAHADQFLLKSVYGFHFIQRPNGTRPDTTWAIVTITPQTFSSRLSALAAWLKAKL